MDELMKASDESQVNQKINLKLYRSSSRDVVTNTATEAFLTSQVSENDVILFFWQNDHSIIIGKIKICGVFVRLMSFYLIMEL